MIRPSVERGRDAHTPRVHPVRPPPRGRPRPHRLRGGRRAALRALRPRPRRAARCGPATSRCASPRCGATARCCRVDDAEQRVTLGEGLTPLLPAPRLGAALGPAEAARQGGGRQPDRLLQGPRPRAGGLDGQGARRHATSACPPPATPAARSPPTPRAPACGPTSSCRRDIARLFVMETEAYGAEVTLVDGLITDAGRLCAEQATRARLVRVRDAQGAVPRRGQEDDGLRARRAARLEAARRDPLPHRRRHRARRHVEGVRGDARRWASCGARAAPHVRRAGRGLRADRQGLPGGPRGRAALGGRARPSPTACACRRRSATS